MNQAGRIISIDPPRAVSGGELIIECENVTVNAESDFGVWFGGLKGRIISASKRRIVVCVPEDFVSGETDVFLESGNLRSETVKIQIAERIAEDLHLVANPAINPEDDSIILTRSGSRGQELPVTMFRFEKYGRLEEIPADVLNPTGLAFDREGKLYATNRADGEVVQIGLDGSVVNYASNLGVATGIAFNSRNEMFVGDRSGVIYKVSELGDKEEFARLESSVAAFHLAFDQNDVLYVSAPTLSSFDAIKTVDDFGDVGTFYRGLGRPQGLAFDAEGNLYLAASLSGRRGIVKISSDGEKAELFAAVKNPVGLCFTRGGEMIIACNEEVFRLPVGIRGRLLK